MFGDVTRKNIPEISRRHCKACASLGRAERNGRGKIIYNLRQYTGPVDRIDPCKMHSIAEFKIIKHILEPRLAIIKVTIKGQGMDVFMLRRGHLASLDF